MHNNGSSKLWFRDFHKKILKKVEGELATKIDMINTKKKTTTAIIIKRHEGKNADTDRYDKYKEKKQQQQ